MADIFCVANYILQNVGSMTTMKLQKLVYYCQAWSLAWDGEPLFEEDFQAWANGPVCPQLYYLHKGEFSVSKDYFNEHECDFSNDQIETMNAVIHHYGDKNPHWLSELTHKELPWREARKGLPPGSRCENIISKENMQEYYGGLDA